MAGRKPMVEKVLVSGTVHYLPDSLSGNVTMCGQTDWLDCAEQPKETTLPCNCNACLAVVAHVRAHHFDD